MLGVVRDPSESALEAFAARQLNVEQLQWADQGRVYKLIEALKAMAERAGWSQNLAHVHHDNYFRTLNRRMCETTFARIRPPVCVQARSLVVLPANTTGVAGAT